MATRKSPLAQVKEKFGDKEKLVDRVLGVISIGEQDRDKLRTRLLAISNRKLIRMLEVSGEIRERFGSTEKLVTELAAALGKAKDQAYLQKLTALAARTPARLLDMMKSASGRAKTAKA
jgi:hypothetical protein